MVRVLDGVLRWRGRGGRDLEDHRGLGVTSPLRLFLNRLQRSFFLKRKISRLEKD